MTQEIIYIAQGEDAVSASENTIITTILGSCISICLWDPIHRLGGMNHLLLPELKGRETELNTSGAVAMERLINQLIHLGGERTQLRAKMFGGSSMLAGMTDIGTRNVAFGRAYLKAENIPLDSESVGGTQARKLRFWPATGAAKQKFVLDAPALAPPVEISTNDVELF